MFMKIGLGSVAVGVAVALIASLVLKISHIHDPLLACGVFIFSSYCAYELTEACHLSGIVASLFAGFCMRNYALENIAPQYQEMVLDMVHMLASMSDLVIFFMVGENVILYMPYDKWWMIFWTITLCLTGRLFNVFPLIGLWNLSQGTTKVTVTLSPNEETERAIELSISEQSIVAFSGVSEGKGPANVVTFNGLKITGLSSMEGEDVSSTDAIGAVLGYSCVSVNNKAIGDDGVDLDAALNDSDDSTVTIELEYNNKVSFKNQIVMYHSGLRGAIAFALALGFPSQHRKYIIDTTTWTILFTVFVFGGTTVPLLSALGIAINCPDDPVELKFIDGAAHRAKARAGLVKKGCLFSLLELEASLKEFITRRPEEELGVFALLWDDLDEDQQEAALVLGYTNDDAHAKTWPEHVGKWGSWLDQTEETQAAAIVLGLSAANWPPPDFSVMGSADDFVQQHKSGHDLMYEEPSETEDATSNPLASDDDDDDDDEDDE